MATTTALPLGPRRTRLQLQNGSKVAMSTATRRREALLIEIASKEGEKMLVKEEGHSAREARQSRPATKGHKAAPMEAMRRDRMASKGGQEIEAHH